MQETEVQSLIRKGPIWCMATKPMHCKDWACALGPKSHSYWVHTPQMLKPACPGACALQHEKPLQLEALYPPQLEQPRLTTGKKAMQQQRPSTDTNKQFFFKSSSCWDIPSDPMIRTPCFHCSIRHRFDPWLRN